MTTLEIAQAVYYDRPLPNLDDAEKALAAGLKQNLDAQDCSCGDEDGDTCWYHLSEEQQVQRIIANVTGFE